MSNSEHAVANRIHSLHIKGFRSLADVRIAKLPNPAVLLGANGSGKSNLLRFFEMVTSMLQQPGLGHFVQFHGGADDQLFQGTVATSRIDASVGLLAEAAQHEYRFSLEYAHPDRLLFADEALGFGQAENMVWHRFGGGHDEAKLPYAKTETDGACEIAARRFKGFFEHCVVHQFHDTSATSRLKVRWDAEESFRLLPHGGNLPSVLLYLSRHDKERFDAICYYVSRILPGFRRFEIEEAHGKTLLRWQASGSSKTIGPHLTSDGSLRFFALVTLLNLPAEVLPEIVLLDEPELGLHASAITLIAEMVKSVALKRQVVVATQSPIFVDFFRPHELVVLELDAGQTLVRRPEELDLGPWLEEYTTGEIWRKNLIGGRP